MKIISGSSNLPLAKDIASEINLSLTPVELHVFPDGERRVQIQEDVVNEDIVIVQSTSTPVDQNYMELFFLIDGVRRSGVKSVTVAMPYFGYQRQDHVFRSGEAVSLEVVIRILESLKVDRLISFDLHTVRIPNLFHVPVSHLSALSLFAEEIKRRNLVEGAFLVSPDLGGVRRIKIISSQLNNMPYIATVKERDLASGEIEINTIKGDVPMGSSTALIVDDMISSGKTMIESAKLLKKSGIEQVLAFATHPIFSEDAPELLEKSDIKQVYVTNSVHIPNEKQFPKLTILSIAKQISKELLNARC